MKKPKSKIGECEYHLCRKRTKVFLCKYCGRYFCKDHIKPQPVLNFQQVSTSKEPLRSKLEEIWRSEKGHPDYAYTPIFWKKIEEEEKIKTERMWEALDTLKELKEVEESKIHKFIESIVNKTKRKIKIRINLKNILFGLIFCLGIFSVVYTLGRQHGYDFFNLPEKYVQQIYTKTNEVRSTYGLHQLEKCETLDKLAKVRMGHILNYYKTNHQLEHYLFEMDTKPYLLSLGKIGENIFLVKEGYICVFFIIPLCVPIGSTGEEMVNGWMNSPGHRSNILSSDYRFISVEVKRYEDKVFALQLFSSSCN
ncbi:MAG: CAP domain-containing protein [Candidatus Aenigmatarchaeota archaeon]